ncbi:MAG TPA: MFS transporter, partial [Dermatophilaceae bacterium]|nr:MFS transporter [Dermatophilaceae bacterium]
MTDIHRRQVPTGPAASSQPSPTGGTRNLMLVLATTGFALNFWAWALLSPLAPRYKEQLGLSGGQQALLVAVPVIVGSLGRIPVGALTDRFGGRVMFPIISVATIVPILFLGLFGQHSLAALLVGGFFLGIGGTAFAIGVPFVNSWFPPERRGFAIGIFGAGMGGTAISALTTVKLVKNVSEEAPFLITAAVLAVYAVVAWLFLRDAPGRVVPTTSVVSRLAAVSKLAVT